ncbi:uncharacterized protein N7529_002081 [Penicillium soppii]|jgi:hypothetical protein|uniref:uncharacterized protein n=1 Tax=Penicillium soppii TaxID=69789 RepID=UPI0025470E01|nr:uncharacterized protein N7529_002081 [Penicillium soppii]KAJ5876497.1 hypothetical protein N7529_002081 [Penicillium soppii]
MNVYIIAFRRSPAILEKCKVALPLGAFIRIIDQLGNESPKMNCIIEQTSRKQSITRNKFNEFCDDYGLKLDLVLGAGLHGSLLCQIV